MFVGLLALSFNNVELLYRGMRMFLPAVLVCVGILAIWIGTVNVRGRRRERELRNKRGAQTATDFAALFESPSEQFVAEKLFPYLQMATFTGCFAFRKEDLLWEPPLNFVEDDVEDNLRLGFWDALELGLSAEGSEFAKPFLSATTVGELVEAVTSFYTRRYGSGEHPSR